MTPNHNEELKDKIIEAVPEIMELELGCQIVLYGDEAIVSTRNRPFSENKEVAFIDKGGVRGITKSMLDNANIRIIGRPIQLADVLLAIPIGMDLYINRHGFMKAWKDKQWIICVPAWNLAADLDGQTEETKEFLWKIICSPNNQNKYGKRKKRQKETSS